MTKLAQFIQNACEKAEPSDDGTEDIVSTVNFVAELSNILKIRLNKNEVMDLNDGEWAPALEPEK